MNRKLILVLVLLVINTPTFAYRGAGNWEGTPDYGAIDRETQRQQEWFQRQENNRLLEEQNRILDQQRKIMEQQELRRMMNPYRY